MRMASARGEAVSLALGIVVLLSIVVTVTAVGVVAGGTARTLSVPAFDAPDGSGAPGFIEVAVDGTPMDGHIEILHAFHDIVLLSNPVGRFVTKTYTLTSPPLAAVLCERESLCIATRLLLVLPLAYLSAFCLNTTAFAAFIVLMLLVLVIGRHHAKVLLKGFLYSALVVAAFTVTIFTLSALGYELPICATIAAYLLPLLIPAAVITCLIVWTRAISMSDGRRLPYYF
jgi:hypothetical protein